MIDAREVVRSIRLPEDDETEVQRVGAEIVAAVRRPDYRGLPIPVDVVFPDGADEDKRGRVTSIALAVQRRFQHERWVVSVEPIADAFGSQTGYRLWVAPDATRLAEAVAEVVSAPERSGSPLRALWEEIGVLYGDDRSGGARALPDAPVLSVIFGTYDRFPHLRRAVESVRRSVGDLTYEIAVCDGGSTDGSRAWLAAQPDVVLVGERRLDGAVRAFNQCYALSRGEYVANLNDDCAVVGDALARAVAYLQEHGTVGQVALAFKGEGEGWHTSKVYPDASWDTTYANFGVVRRSVSDAVARVQGGFWNPLYRTYAADCEHSCWVRCLGFGVVALPDCRVEDARAADGLREKNMRAYVAETRQFYARWPPRSLAPGGPEPRVTAGEAERFKEAVGGLRVGLYAGASSTLPVFPASAPPAQDAVAQMAALCGLPHPEEERRLARLAPLVRALDPTGERFPARAERLGEERVLHVSLCTDADPQAGLVRALRALGSRGYREVRWWADYGQDAARRREAILAAARDLRPTLVFMQFQAGGAVDAETVREVRRLTGPSCVVATWCGDVAGENRPHDVDWQADLGRVVDLTFHSSMAHVRALRGAGVHTAAYLQIGYDEEQYRVPLWDERWECVDFSRRGPFDVAFLGSRYGQGDPLAATYRWASGAPAHDAALRDEVVDGMRAAFGDRFGLYGSGWGEDTPSVKLDRAHEVYWRSKIGLSISLDNKLECYTSDRLFRVLGCGALLLVKRFPGMGVLRLEHADNCVAFDTAEDAVTFARFYASADSAREHIVAAGATLAREHHTWGVRMLELQKYVDAVRGARR